MFIKFIVSAFVLFAISRVWLRYRDGALGIFGMSLWSLLWLAVGAFVWLPVVTDYFAHKLGFSSGVNALVDFSIVGLLYGVFRLYVKMEFIEHELTNLIRALALKEKE